MAKDSIDYGQPDELTDEEKEELHRESEANRMKGEIAEAKKEHTLPRKVKRFFEKQTAKSPHAEHEKELASRPQYSPPRKTGYNAPTRNFSRALFGFGRDTKRFASGISREMKHLSKDVKKAKGELGMGKKGKKKDSFFSTAGTDFASKKTGKSDFLSSKGTMFASKRKKEKWF